MTTLQIGFGFCAAASLGGVLMNLIILFGKAPPRPLGIGHGLAGLVGIATIFAAALQGGGATPNAVWQGFGLLTAAMLAGLTILRTLYNGHPPFWLGLVHGGIAVAGLYLLWPSVS